MFDRFDLFDIRCFDVFLIFYFYFIFFIKKKIIIPSIHARSATRRTVSQVAGPKVRLQSAWPPFIVLTENTSPVEEPNHEAKEATQNNKCPFKLNS